MPLVQFVDHNTNMRQKNYRKPGSDVKATVDSGSTISV